MARRVLLIGGAGYIGTVLTEHLLQAGYHVRSLDALIYKSANAVWSYLSHPNYEFQRGNLCKLEDVDRALPEVTDVVVLAGLVGDPITKKYPELSDKINDRGIIQLLGHLGKKDIDRCVFISTCSNYGMIGEDELATEDWDLKPLSLYAKAKVGAEKFLLDQGHDFTFSPTVLRFATAFGLSPRMRFDLTLSEFTRDLYLGKELVVYDEKTWRPYCHVRDFCRAIQLVLEADKSKVSCQVFNAGGDANNFTKEMMVNTICEFLPNSKISFQQAGSDPRNYRVSFKKIKDALHFEPQYSVLNGIEELLEALQQGLFEHTLLPREFFGNYVIDEERVS